MTDDSKNDPLWQTRHSQEKPLTVEALREAHEMFMRCFDENGAVGNIYALPAYQQLIMSDNVDDEVAMAVIAPALDYIYTCLMGDNITKDDPLEFRFDPPKTLEELDRRFEAFDDLSLEDDMKKIFRSFLDHEIPSEKEEKFINDIYQLIEHVMEKISTAAERKAYHSQGREGRG